VPVPILLKKEHKPIIDNDDIKNLFRQIRCKSRSDQKAVFRLALARSSRKLRASLNMVSMANILPRAPSCASLVKTLNHRLYIWSGHIHPLVCGLTFRVPVFAVFGRPPSWLFAASEQKWRRLCFRWNYWFRITMRSTVLHGNTSYFVLQGGKKWLNFEIWYI